MQGKRWGGAAVLLLVGNLAWAASENAFEEHFESGLKPAWQSVDFEGKTDYKTVSDGTNTFLCGHAASSASGLG